MMSYNSLTSQGLFNNNSYINYQEKEKNKAKENKMLIDTMFSNLDIILNTNNKILLQNFIDELIKTINDCREKEKGAIMFGASKCTMDLYEKIINILINININNITSAINQIKIYFDEITISNKVYSYIEPFTNLNNNFKVPEKEEIKEELKEKKEKKEVKEKCVKKRIPAALRTKVWNTNISEETKIGKCNVCDVKINFDNFHCGHVISEHNGGEVKLDNLKPLCMLCNTSMGKNNMNDFIELYGFKNTEQFKFTDDSKISDVLNSLDKTTRKKLITMLYEKKLASLSHLIN